MSVEGERLDAPVFFDMSGRRWKRVRLVLLTVGLLVAAGLYYALPLAWHHDMVPAYKEPLAENAVRLDDMSLHLEPAAVTAMSGHRNTPVIGAGPLVRVLHVKQTDEGAFGSIMYADRPARPLDEREMAIVGSHDYVIERYGAVSVHKQIALTFDDGPDAKYTPQILDVLGRHGAQATFFVTGANVVKHSEIARREAREGHLVANHTFNHIDFDMVSRLRGEQEINQTTRVIAAATGTESSFFRLPYMGVDEQTMRNHLTGILTAQRMGYVVASNEYDSSDWGFETGTKPALPKLDGSSLVVLLHDAGGNRSKTVAYLEKLIADAKSKGYRFVTLDQMYHQEGSGNALYAPVVASTGDKTSFTLASSILVWPHQVISQLFVWTVATLLLTLGVNVVLALLNRRRTHFGARKRGYEPLVSVLVPAYNEGIVLEKSVRPVLRSNYRNLEVIIVDDGSKDDTFVIAQSLARRFGRVSAYRAPRNQGKAAALNLAIKHARGDIMVAIDADTVFPPTTVGRLVRHFSDPEVGAVAGNVRVGNVSNMVTRWQALDYVIGIHIERNAQACLGAVMIVPGACGAFRKEAIVAAGGYSHHTLAEDFDLTLSVQRLGYKVLQDNSADSYTEAPETVKTLAKQRFRWMYGNVQAYWKHRDMLFRRRHGWAGMFVLPWMIFAFVLPLVFVPMLMFVAIENILAGNARSMLIFFVATIAIQAIIAVIGVALARERWSLLLAVPMTRLMYNPMRTILMYRTLLNVLRGVAVGWNKLQRTGTVGQALGYARRARQPQVMPALIEQEDTAG